MTYNQVYDEFFQIDVHWPRRCELTGSTVIPEIHHIKARGMGGSNEHDGIENLMCLQKKAHYYFGDKEQFMDFLIENHKLYMDDGIPFIERKISNPIFTEFLKLYDPTYVISISFNSPYEDLKRKNIKGYIWGHLSKVTLAYLHDTCGIEVIKTKGQAIKHMKEPMGFYEIDEDENEVLLSIADAPIDRLSSFVENLFIFLNDNGCPVKPPQKKR